MNRVVVTIVIIVIANLLHLPDVMAQITDVRQVQSIFSPQSDIQTTTTSDNPNGRTFNNSPQRNGLVDSIFKVDSESIQYIVSKQEHTFLFLLQFLTI